MDLEESTGGSDLSLVKTRSFDGVMENMDPMLVKGARWAEQCNHE